LESSVANTQEEEDLMDNISVLSRNSYMDEGEQGWQASKSKKARKTKKRKVVGATRTSSRIARDRISTVGKASSLASIMYNIQGITSSIPFTILNSMPISAMQSIMVDLDIEVDNVEEQLRGFQS